MYNNLDICPICDSHQIQQFIEHKKKGWGIKICLQCKNAYTVPQPKVNYDHHSFSELVIEDENRWRSYAKQIVSFIQKDISEGRLLDIGCGGGLLIEETQKVGFTAEGIEPSLTSVNHCKKRGLMVKHGYLEPESYLPNSFDIVTMSHVLEHVYNPFELFAIIKTILKPGGYIFLSQTNYLGTLPSLFGRYWPAWVPAEHLVHFSPTGIKTFLSKVDFEIASIELTGLGYYFYIDIKKPRDILGFGLNTGLYILDRLKLGNPFRGDQLYVLATVDKRVN